MIGLFSNKPIFRLCIALFAFYLWSGSLLMAQDGLYTISDIYVELSGDEPQAMKQQALQEAKQVAFTRLLRRLTFESDQQLILRQIDSLPLDQLIRDINYKDEKIGSNIYQALISIRFNKAMLEDFFEQNGIIYSASLGPKLLVLPLLELGEYPLIWQDDNPLLLALQENLAHQQDHLLRIQLPKSDMDHEKIIAFADLIESIRKFMQDPNQPIPANLSRLIAYYEVDGLLVFNVKISRFGIADIAETLLIPIAKTWQQPYQPLKFTGNVSEPRAEFIYRIAQEGMIILNRLWKTRTFVGPDEATNNIAIKSDINGINDWQRLKAFLQAIPGFVSLNIDAMQTKQIWLQLTLRGGVEQLIPAINAKGYRLMAPQEKSEFYQLVMPQS